MRTLIFVSLALCTVSILHAQLNKGQWLVGGSAGFTATNHSVDNGSTKTTNLQLNPGVGYFVINKLAVGVRAGVIFGHELDNYGTPRNTFETNTTGLSVTPYLRYYFLPKTNKINLLGDISYSNINSKITSATADAPNSTSKSNGHAFTFAAGPAFFINRHIALEITASYELYKIDNYDQNIFMLNAGFQIHL